MPVRSLLRTILKVSKDRLEEPIWFKPFVMNIVNYQSGPSIVSPAEPRKTAGFGIRGDGDSIFKNHPAARA